MIRVTGFTRSARFEAEVGCLQPDTIAALGEALKLLLANPSAGRLRLHSLKGYSKPTIYKIDVFANKSWQVTFELEGTTAHLRRIAPHAKIDRDPR